MSAITKSGVLLLSSCLAFAQTSPARRFVVASVKPSAPPDFALIGSGKVHIGVKMVGLRIDIGLESMAKLIALAFGVAAENVVGPSWISEARYDIEAEAPAGSTKDDLPEMLRVLLADRFGLVTHRRTEMRNGYVLNIGKDVARLKAATTQEAPTGENQGQALNIGQGDARVSGSLKGKGLVASDASGMQMKVTMADGMVHMENVMTMGELADEVKTFLDGPVVDRTGLKGRYQVPLDLSMNDFRNPRLEAAVGAGLSANPTGTDHKPDPGSSVFGSIEKLGLRLDREKLPVDVIVIDRVNRSPGEN